MTSPHSAGLKFSDFYGVKISSIIHLHAIVTGGNPITLRLLHLHLCCSNEGKVWGRGVGSIFKYIWGFNLKKLKLSQLHTQWYIIPVGH